MVLELMMDSVLLEIPCNRDTLLTSWETSIISGPANLFGSAL